jgi:hypothetical protein
MHAAAPGAAGLPVTGNGGRAAQNFHAVAASPQGPNDFSGLRMIV